MVWPGLDLGVFEKARTSELWLEGRCPEECLKVTLWWVAWNEAGF